jgi:hypothetical protein
MKQHVDSAMRRLRQRLTLGDLVYAVSQCSRNCGEASLVVADLMQRGIVRLSPRPKHIQILPSTH